MRYALSRAAVSSGALAAVLFAGSVPALAQDVDAPEAAAASSEIIVTAQRRAERSVDVPISVTSLGEQQLATANVQELADITRITPGLRFDNAGGFFQPTIRGIGTAVVTSGGGGNVGIYVDGFYSPNPLATNMQLMKLQNIQVLKGPQGTLFGRNTTGGAILLQTAEPSTDTGGEFKVSYGRYNELRSQAYATIGLSENVAFDIEGMYNSGSGWQREISTGSRVGGYENTSVRLGLKADLTENISVLLRYQHGDIDDPSPLLAASYTGPDIAFGAPFFAAPGQYTFGKNQIASGSVPEFFRSKSDVFQATIKADIGFADLTSYTQYRKENVSASQDLDYSGVDVFQLGLPNFNRTTSQEFLLSSKPGGRLQWTAGLFYFQNKDIYQTFFNNAGNGPASVRFGGSGTTTRSYAAFLDATYEVTPKLFLTAGARYAKDKVVNAYWNPSLFKGFDPTSKNFVPDISDDRITPRFVIRFKPDEQSSIYASYTKGYKAAIIDVGGSCQSNPLLDPSTGLPICNAVNPESIDAFEIGYKYNDSGLSFEVSGFYYDYKDLQVSIFRTATAEIINAATSEIYGVDGQLRYQVSDNFELSVGAAWTHARYKDFDTAPIYTPCPDLFPAGTCAGAPPAGFGGVSFIVVPTPLSNVTMQRTPEFTGNVGARYMTDLADGRLALSGNLFYSSKFFFGPSGVQFPQKGFETLSLRAEWSDPSDRFAFALWGDNVTNSRYKTQVQYSSFGLGSNWSKPTTYGVEVGVKF